MNFFVLVKTNAKFAILNSRLGQGTPGPDIEFYSRQRGNWYLIPAYFKQ